MTLLLKELVNVSAESAEDCSLEAHDLKFLRLATGALPCAFFGHDTPIDCVL